MQPSIALLEWYKSKLGLANHLAQSNNIICCEVYKFSTKSVYYFCQQVNIFGYAIDC